MRSDFESKKPTNYRYGSAVAAYSTEVIRAIEALGLSGIEIVVVPSCKASNVSVGLDRIAREAAAKFPGAHYRSQSLHRTRTIDKLSQGGNRSLLVHRISMAFRTAPVRFNGVLLLDDVCTTGNSIIAAADKITEAYAQAYGHRPKITVLVLGRTVHE